MGKRAFEIWKEEGLAERWAEMIRPIFPSNSTVGDASDGGNFIIAIDWKLNSDPKRPNKHSHMIHLKIAEEMIEDFVPDQLRELDRRIKNFVEENFKGFNPEHDAPYNADPSPVKWLFEK